MDIPPKFKLTQEMLELCAQIEAKKALFGKIPQLPQFINNLQRQSMLKSSLFSAKIEGNSLNLSDLDDFWKIDPDLKERIEIENILSAFSFIKEDTRGIDKDFILNIHRIVMKGLNANAGHFRTEASAIYNQSGFPVYIPPPPSEIDKLIEKLINYINSNEKENVLIKSALVHLLFEKIHPFLDGNGRVGRLLCEAILARGNYHFNWLLTLEEGINEKKEEYYVYLDKDDAVSFIEFMLEIILDSAKKILETLSGKEINYEDLLLPRRKEILDIIRDHGMISMDSIKRRFLKVSGRTIRYDLKKLEDGGYIIKAGTTRGAMYKAK